jgi:hypothetical protein
MTPQERKKYMKEYRKNNHDKILKKTQEWKAKQNSIPEIKQKLDISEAEEIIIPPMKEEIKEKEIPIQEEKPKQETPIETEETPPSQAETKTDFFENLRANYKKTENTQEKKDEPIAEAHETHTESVQEEVKAPQSRITPNAETQTLITGYLFLLAVNSVYPDMLLWVLARANKKFRGIDSDNITLDSDDLQMIEPIADEVVKIYLPKMNPALLLFVCMNAMYYQNIKKEVKTNKQNKTRI